MLLKYAAPEHVCEAIAALSRTEDVKFSPNNRRLAVASFPKNQITLFDICIDKSADRGEVFLTDAATISSPYLKQPHGISFIDEETIIVANRLGDATVFRLPSGGGGKCYELVPIEVIRAGDILTSPGAVSITKKSDDVYEALICSNFGNNVTRHVIDVVPNCSVRSSEALLRKWLQLPNGVSVHPPWIAISNYNTHSVLLYENTVSLNENSDPDGILRGALYPHGLRFTADGRFILVADAGAPYVHIYMIGDSGWRGVHSPVKSVRVLSDKEFVRGQTIAGWKNIRVGGPKGLDIDSSMSALVTTCEVQTLAFFDFAEILETIPILQGMGTQSSLDEASYDNHCRTQKALELKYELHRLEIQNQSAKATAEAIAGIKNTLSWRVTAPLRRVRNLASRSLRLFGAANPGQ